MIKNLVNTIFKFINNFKHIERIFNLQIYEDNKRIARKLSNPYDMIIMFGIFIISFSIFIYDYIIADF